MKKIQILMSTYNGQKYLKEQIDSILAQDCENEGNAHFTLLIRDDGSTDGTQNLLEEYSHNYPDRIKWYQGSNIGVIQSFFDLMKNADKDADYFALADQDDYWLPDKMSAAVQRLEIMSKKENAKVQDFDNEMTSVNNKNEIIKPLLYCCQPTPVDEKLEKLSSDIKNPEINPGFGNALIENIVTGCTAVFNNKLRLMVIEQFPGYTTMHDRWLYLVATCFGEIYYDKKSYIYYRQHGGNAVGKNTNKFAELKYRIRKFKKDSQSSSRQAAEFMRIFKPEFADKESKSCSKELSDKEKLLGMFIKGKRRGKIRRKLVNSGKIYRQRKMDNRIFKVLIIMNIY